MPCPPLPGGKAAGKADSSSTTASDVSHIARGALNSQSCVPEDNEGGLPASSGIRGTAAAKPPTGSSARGYAQASVPGVSGEHADKILQSMQVNRDELHFADMIGSGVTAEVFKGSWRGRQVAIKRLNLTTKSSSQWKQETAFLRETGVIAKLNHEYLVKFYGLAFEALPYLLITELCLGGSAYDLLHESDMDLVLPQQLKMCQDTAKAMEYLHAFRPQIIHRDLKSLNLLLMGPVANPSDVPHVKVSDFGLARMKDKDSDWGKMTVEAGTFHWMAPEVGTGNYTEKADVYSFAMVLFEIICQEVPFEDLEPVDVLEAAMAGQRPEMEAVPPTTPKALVVLMEDCWKHKANERPSFEYICTVFDQIHDQVLGRSSTKVDL